MIKRITEIILGEIRVLPAMRVARGRRSAARQAARAKGSNMRRMVPKKK
jgi:hypothetical protein